LASLIGQEGEARTEIGSEGSVYVNGELWSARSNQLLSAGTRVRVLERQGLVLTVEPVETSREAPNS
jgi:membrane-bound serine protease (ClpP class)